MKLFQVNRLNYIAVESVAAITFVDEHAVVFTSQGIKHRITAEQARLLISCFQTVKPLIDITNMPMGT